MKKAVLIIVLSFSIILSLGILISNTDVKFSSSEIIQIGSVAILILFARVPAFARIRSKKTGLPAEDEFSKKLIKNAAARSYYFSLYLWLGIMYLNSEGKIDQENILSIGIVGMAVLFGVHWIILKFTGLKDE